jgi:UDP-N-acetylmuramyl pentapeptide phosphotransferase/UDP-N-acetylglucosamine-1-phosphate transferase
MAGDMKGLLLCALAASCAVLSFLLNRLLMPAYRRYALARPNARSSHKISTPQGGGVGVLGAMLIGPLIFAATPLEAPLWSWNYALLAVGAGLLAVVGALDDIYELPVVPRLLFQALAAGLGLAALLVGRSAVPMGMGLLLIFPAGLLALVWFVNLTNFMDGIDGMTVAELVPIGAGLALLALSGTVPLSEGVTGTTLLGALAGFAPDNRHVARLFLGDVGSLPLGLIAGWLLFALALGGQPVAALILPLYYLADATITLSKRIARGENIAKAHRTHFYQRAADLGWSVPAITGRIWMLNGALCVLALASVGAASIAARAVILAAAVALVALTLVAFSRPAK